MGAQTKIDEGNIDQGSNRFHKLRDFSTCFNLKTAYDRKLPHRNWKFGLAYARDLFEKGFSANTLNLYVLRSDYFN